MINGRRSLSTSHTYDGAEVILLFRKIKLASAWRSLCLVALMHNYLALARAERAIRVLKEGESDNSIPVDYQQDDSETDASAEQRLLGDWTRQRAQDKLFIKSTRPPVEADSWGWDGDNSVFTVVWWVDRPVPDTTQEVTAR